MLSMVGIYYHSFNFANFVISNALVKIKASTDLRSIHILSSVYLLLWAKIVNVSKT